MGRGGVVFRDFAEGILSSLGSGLAGVAQLVEQLTCNQQVTSSSLVASSSIEYGSAAERRAGSEAVKRIRL